MTIKKWKIYLSYFWNCCFVADDLNCIVADPCMLYIERRGPKNFHMHGCWGNFNLSLYLEYSITHALHCELRLGNNSTLH